MDHNIENQIREFLQIRDAIKTFEPKLKDLENQLKQYMTDNEIKKITVDGRTITLVSSPGVRNFNAEELQKLISAAVFKQVTEPKVKTELLDAAVSLGKIPQDVVDQVTTKTPYNQLRVN
jgi:hypothetical protein